MLVIEIGVVTVDQEIGGASEVADARVKPLGMSGQEIARFPFVLMTLSCKLKNWNASA